MIRCKSFAALLALGVALFPARLFCEEPAPLPAGPVLPRAKLVSEGGDLRVFLLTMGPGEHPFFKFGHNAIWIRDAHGDVVYNFGTFGFDSPWLIVDFLRGRLMYWLSTQSLRATIADYGGDRRGLVAQELNLTTAQKRELAAALRINAREENKHYKYDYYLDNCSTRVRDAIDRTMGGRLRAAASGQGTYTFRQHTLRHVADHLPVYLGLHVIMGGAIDRPVTQWEEMFLPEKLKEGVRAATVIGDAGEEPLVAREVTLLLHGLASARTAPPHWFWRFVAAGLGLGLLGALALIFARRGLWRRRLLCVVLGLYGTICGTLGTIFAGMWAFTDHEVAHRNENLLQLGPWAWLLLYAAQVLWRDEALGLKWARRAAFCCLTGSVLGLLLALLPGFIQQNGEIIALMLPLYAGLFLGIELTRRRRA